MKHFLDIGANRGDTFKLFLDTKEDYKDYKIWCFEPSIRHLPGLEELVKAYSDKYQVHICPAAIGGESRVTQFYEKHCELCDSIFPEGDQNNKIKKKPYGFLTSVLCITDVMNYICDIDENAEFEIKLDCEGCEYEILREIVRHKWQFKIITIHVEFHQSSFENQKQELIELYNRLGIPLVEWNL